MLITLQRESRKNNIEFVMSHSKVLCQQTMHTKLYAQEKSLLHNTVLKIKQVKATSIVSSTKPSVQKLTIMQHMLEKWRHDFQNALKTTTKEIKSQTLLNMHHRLNISM